MLRKTKHGDTEVCSNERVYSPGSQAGAEGDGTPLQSSCLENPVDGGFLWAAVHGVAKSQTRLSDFPFTFHFHALEKEMAAHSSVLAWDGGAWWAAVYGVTRSWTRLKRLSSSQAGRWANIHLLEDRGLRVY